MLLDLSAAFVMNKGHVARSQCSFCDEQRPTIAYVARSQCSFCDEQRPTIVMLLDLSAAFVMNKGQPLLCC